MRHNLKLHKLGVNRLPGIGCLITKLATHASWIGPFIDVRGWHDA